MARDVLLCLLGTLITLLCWAALSVRALLKRGGASTASPNPLDSSAIARRLETLEADQVALSSNLEKVCTTAKRLTSRAGMQDLRERRRESSSAPPPPGAPKAELLKYYGMSGKVGPAFAQAQLDLERSNSGNERPN